MKNRSELREIAMKALYQVYIYENTKTEYSVKSIIKELLEVENDLVNELVNGVISIEFFVLNILSNALTMRTSSDRSNALASMKTAFSSRY